MVPLRHDNLPAPIPASPPERAAVALLNHLRLVAMACRAKPRTDLFRACALLHTRKSASQAAHAEALMRCLREALGKAPRLHAPGTDEMSFDEAWLVQLVRACMRNDTASLHFLLRSRVLPEHRRLVRFLICRICDQRP